MNNLLAGIVGKAFLAKMKARDRPEVLPYLESIEEISRQAGEMVKQLLTFSHKDVFSKKQDTPLAVLIKEGYKTAKLGTAENIDLSLSITAPDISVHCDANQIQQVLMNMMNNARDAVADSDEKRICISLDVCRADAAFFHQHPELLADDKASVSEYACLSISDSGHGMSAETMEKIFDPFYTTKEVGEGTGLGLSSAFGSVTSHGGVIEVDSEPGSGTTFCVYLPIIEVMETSFDDANNLPVLRSTRHEMLLLVDDEPLIVESIQGVLESLGYKLITASNGIEGLTCFRQYQNEIAAIITDITMPKMGGVEMFREIRYINAEMPTIFITGYDHNIAQLQDKEKRNTSIISKPVEIPGLSRIIHNMLNET